MNPRSDAIRGLEADTKPVSQITKALRELKPNQRRRKLVEFTEHYQEIAALVEQGVTIKDIREALAKGGLSMSAATFKKMFETERKRRAHTNQTDETYGGKPSNSTNDGIGGAT
jgi:DNA-binding transcriptional MerR regulator